MRRTLVALVTVLAVAGFVIGPQAGPANAAEYLADGSFEAAGGSAANGPNWNEADSVFGTPLCDLSSCGGVGPRTGTWWAWFGGTSAAQTSSLTQTLTIPSGAAVLSFYLFVSSDPDGNNASLTVKLDSTTLHTYADPPVDSGYTLRSFDISSFADGGSHTLAFNYVNPAASSLPRNMHLDDVSINNVQTATPVVSQTTPDSPASSTTPSVSGTAESGSTVLLYDNAACTGSPLATGTAAAFTTTGLAVTVPTNQATQIHARAVKIGQADSWCSAVPYVYIHDSVAPVRRRCPWWHRPRRTPTWLRWSWARRRPTRR